jgi:adenylosuccinate synthase
VATVTNEQAILGIAPGSEIDLDVLWGEVFHNDQDWKIQERLWIDPEATLIEEKHKDAETVIGTGTTGKGIGAARGDRLVRNADLFGSVPPGIGRMDDMSKRALMWLREGGTVMIEGTQGFGLGQHAGFYPFCTSSDCRAIDFMSMAGISPWANEVSQLEVWIVYRTFPIRIAGNSGPLFAEKTWDELGGLTGGHVQPEFTTVTQKMRRVGEWDSTLAQAAFTANGGVQGNMSVKIALTFFDYWFPELANVQRQEILGPKHLTKLTEIGKEIGAEVELIGTGPQGIIDLRK